MQHGCVLRDHPDLLAQAVLRRQRDVLPIDQDAAALDVVQTKQQVDQRRLARARAPDQPDLLARRDVQREVVDHAAGLAVVKAHVLEPDRASRGRQRARVVAVLQRARPRYGAHAFLHLSDVVENADRRPHDPPRHGDDAKRRPVASAMSPSVIAPSDQSQTASPATATRRAALPDDTVRFNSVISGSGGERRRYDRRALHARAGPPLEVSEQLDRLDVRVTVDDAADHRRAGVCEFFGSAPYLRDEIRERKDVRDDPDRERARKPQVGLRQDDQCADGEHGYEPERIDDLHHRFPERGGRLHDVRGDAPGEVVGEIGDRLSQEISMGLPAIKLVIPGAIAC